MGQKPNISNDKITDDEKHYDVKQENSNHSVLSSSSIQNKRKTVSLNGIKQTVQSPEETNINQEQQKRPVYKRTIGEPAHVIMLSEREEKLRQELMWKHVVDRIFKETDIKKYISDSDYDWFCKYKLTPDARVESINIFKISMKGLKKQYEEINVSYTIYLEEDEMPLLKPHDIVQFSYSDNEKNHYRFSLHFSSNVDGEFLTIHVRYIPSVLDESRKRITKGIDKEAAKIALQILDKGGLILVGGGYGQGKTTFVYYLISEWIGRGNTKKIIITIEDVIESYLPFPSKQMEMPTDLWVDALKAVRRENPSLLFIGEILDHNMASVLIQYAASGLPVITTIHASSTANIFSHLESLLALAGIKDPAGAIAYAISGTVYVEMVPTEYLPITSSGDVGIRQIAEVVDWASLKGDKLPPMALKQHIESDTISNFLYSSDFTNNKLSRQYFRPLWESAKTFGLTDYAHRIKKMLKPVYVSKQMFR